LVPYEGLIAEIKKSSKNQKSALMQLAFYLYYFKYKKGVELRGKLVFPKEKKQIEIKLNGELERELEETIKGIKNIVKLPKPPPAEWNSYCKNCAYKAICWV
jgi:CRISPR-associated exonuclease Cas4